MLSQRLQKIFDMIEDCEVLLDVGSDHGLLPYALLNQGRVKSALISDINPEPLNRARETLKAFDEFDQVHYLLSDGLSRIENAFDAVVIAGMGYTTIQNILLSAQEKLRNCQQILLQSNTHVPLLRQLMYQHNYQLVDEALIKDRKHYYTILKYHPNHEDKVLKPVDVLCGPIIRLQNEPVFKSYLEFLIEKERIKMKGQNLTSTINYEILKEELQRISTQ